MTVDVPDLILRHFTVDPPYDPEKAHEYYLRTRKLKGRQAAVVKLPTPRTGAHNVPAPLKANPAAAAAAKKAHAEARAKEIKAKVADLQAKLDRLDALIKRLVEQAKGRSGVKPTKAAAEKTSGKTTKEATTSHLTAAQKAEKAKKEKAAYQKNIAQHPELQIAELDKKIAAARKRIVALKAEIAKNHGASSGSKSGSVGARNTNNTVGRNSQNGRR